MNTMNTSIKIDDTVTIDDASTIPGYPRFVRVFGWDHEHDVSDPAGDVLSPQLYTDDECLDWVGTHVEGVHRESLHIHGREIWVGGACAVLAVIE